MLINFSNHQLSFIKKIIIKKRYDTAFPRRIIQYDTGILCIIHS